MFALLVSAEMSARQKKIKKKSLPVEELLKNKFDKLAVW